MKRNWRRSKTCAFCRAIKEKPTIIETHETPIRVWKPKSKVTILRKKLNRNADRFIHPSYEKHRSRTKFIFDAKCKSYIHISKVKCRTQIRIPKEAGLKFVFQRLNMDLRVTL